MHTELPPPPMVDRTLHTSSLVRDRLPAAIGAVALIAVLSNDDGLVLCPFRRTTDAYCPLCGGTRAAGALVRGEVGTSWALHPLVILLALQLPVFVWLTVSRSADGRRTQWLRRLLVANLALATVIWVVRLTTGDLSPPTRLAWPL